MRPKKKLIKLDKHKINTETKLCHIVIKTDIRFNCFISGHGLFFKKCINMCHCLLIIQVITYLIYLSKMFNLQSSFNFIILSFGQPY